MYLYMKEWLNMILTCEQSAKFARENIQQAGVEQSFYDMRHQWLQKKQDKSQLSTWPNAHLYFCFLKVHSIFFNVGPP